MSIFVRSLTNRLNVNVHCVLYIYINCYIICSIRTVIFYRDIKNVLKIIITTEFLFCVREYSEHKQNPSTCVVELISRVVQINNHAFAFLPAIVLLLYVTHLFWWD